MKIEVKEEVTKEVEIEPPHYRKSESGLFYYKVFSEEKCLQVTTKSDIQIGVFHAGLAFEGSYPSVECTKGEFELAFFTALIELKGIAERQFIDPPF